MNNVEVAQEYCQSLHKEVTSEFPFGEDTLTMKIGGKIFCFISLEGTPSRISIKGDPETIADLKENREAAFNGPYLNKKHWTSIYLGSDIDDEELRTLVRRSYELVFATLTKKVREELG